VTAASTTVSLPPAAFPSSPPRDLDPGSLELISDGLASSPPSAPLPVVQRLLPTSTIFLQRVAAAQSANQFFASLSGDDDGTTAQPDFTLVDIPDSTASVWLYRGRVAIPTSCTDIMSSVLRDAHDRRGHPLRDETLRNLRGLHFFPRCSGTKFVDDYIDSCIVCQQTRTPTEPAIVSAMSVRPEPCYPFEIVIMDYMGPFPTSSEGFVYIITGTCMFSRYLEAEAVRTADASTSLSFFQSHFEFRWGLPRVVQVDGGKHFLGSFAEHLKQSSVSVHVTHAYAPQSNGRGERQHGTLTGKLRGLINSNLASDWHTFVPHAVFLTNSSPNRGLGNYSSLSVVTGRDHLTSLDLKLPQTQRRLQLSVWKDLVSATQEHANLLSLLSSTRERASRSSRFPSVNVFAADDYVLVFFPSRPSKLHSFWRGPYKVVSVDSIEHHYLVSLLELNGSLAAPISVHARRLLAYNFTRSSAALEAARVLPRGELVVDDILSHRVDAQGRLEFEVRWLGFTASTFLPPSELTRLEQFKAYCTRHKIRTRAVRQAAAERAEAKLAPAPA
jgi:hypothetical protein